MATPKLKTETTYLREFMKSYISELSWTPSVEEEMRRWRISLVGLYAALRSGRVVHSDKEEAHVAIWLVEGQTEEDVPLRLWLEVQCNLYQVCVVGIIRLTE
jgi:hypothetical protein